MFDRQEKCPVFIPPEDHSLPEPREERDFLIMRLIYEYDGVLTDDQIKKLVSITDGPFEQRMRRMVYHHYIHKLDSWKRKQFTFGPYWLAERGARYVAGLAGDESQWRDYCFRESRKWKGVRHPRLDNLIHNTLIVDFRLSVEESCQVNSDLKLRRWVNESIFKADPDTVPFRNRKNQERRRNFIPDGYYIIDDTGNRRLYRLFLELDNGMKDGYKMLDEKLLIGAAYVTSALYQQRFAATHGWYTYVCHDQRGADEARVQLLKRYIEQFRPQLANLFFFTTLDLVRSVEDRLTTPIWWRGGQAAPVALIST